MNLPYRISRIPKYNGKFREIYVPSHEYKSELREFIPELEKTLEKLDIYKLNYAFQKGRNCALNAMQHMGYNYTLSMDIEDFFNNIYLSHVTGLISKRIIDRCFIDGNPKQGLPTSPLIATIAFLRCDGEIFESLSKTIIKFSYTRYADDLIISFNDFSDVGKISFIVKQAVERNGFKINRSKTNVQSSKNGRVVINGISVTSNGLFATRRTKKKIRAAEHQKNNLSLKGLLEWSSCKLPKSLFSKG